MAAGHYIASLIGSLGIRTDVSRSLAESDGKQCEISTQPRFAHTPADKMTSCSADWSDAALPMTLRALGHPAAVYSLVALLIVFAANLFAIAYVSAEHYIYYWDWWAYWSGFQQLGELARRNAYGALVAVSSSIRTDDYNLLQVVPLIPFELIGGGGRTSYIVAITNMGVLPSAALMALVAERVAERHSWPRFLFCTAVMLSFHPLWAAALRGFPDVIGVAVASLIILICISKPFGSQRAYDFVRLGILLCLLVLIRRWYAFWVVAFFPAAILACFVSQPHHVFERHHLQFIAKALGTAGAVFVLLILMLAGPVVVHAASTNYSVAFEAYRSNLDPIAQVVNQFGSALLVLAGLGLTGLALDRRTRCLGVFLIVQAALCLALFVHVQKFLGVQHYYLLVPTVGIGVASSLRTIWNARLGRAWRIAGLAGILGINLLSSIAVFGGNHVIAAPLLPVQTYPPLVRPDVAEIDHMLDDIAHLKPRQVYVVASSEILNSSILKVRCRESHPELCSRIAITSDIDTRDGFPSAIAQADYAVVASPVQYHVSPTDQQIVGLLARDISQSRGIGTSFQALPPTFHLEHGVTVKIYRRDRSIKASHLKALSDELRSHHRGMTIFEYKSRQGQ